MNKFKLILEKSIQETENVKSLIFKTENNEKINFEPGQYLNFFFPNDNNEHGKSYTISSNPNEDLRITVKKIGIFSEKLHNMKKGDVVDAMGPAGFMTLSEVEDMNKDIVFIAGGVGITAFYPLITELISFSKNKKWNNEISLFYGVKKSNDIIFFDYFKNLSKNTQNFKDYYFLSQEKNNENSNNIINKRIDIEYIKNNTNFNNSNFFICGTIEFVNQFWKELKNNNIKEEDIYTESFFIG